MELRHLRYFAAVAAHGSFNRAAKNLHLTQPALSRQVKDLEDELGVPLFVRGKNAVTLTAAGELFYEEARDLLARADQAIQRVRGEARSEMLRVGYAPSLTTGVMPRAIEKVQATAPARATPSWRICRQGRWPGRWRRATGPGNRTAVRRN